MTAPSGKPVSLAAVRALWASMAISIVVYVGVAFLALSDEPADPSKPHLLEVLFMMLSVVTAAVGLWLPRWMLSEQKLKKVIHAARERAAAGSGAASPPPGNVVSPKALRSGVIQPFFITVILQLALFESIAVLGFVLAFIAQDATQILPFAGVALVLDLITFPRFEPVLQRAKRIVRRRD